MVTGVRITALPAAAPELTLTEVEFEVLEESSLLPVPVAVPLASLVKVPEAASEVPVAVMPAVLRFVASAASFEAVAAAVAEAAAVDAVSLCVLGQPSSRTGDPCVIVLCETYRWLPIRRPSSRSGCRDLVTIVAMPKQRRRVSGRGGRW